MSLVIKPLLSLRGWSLDRHTPTGLRPVLTDIDLDILPGRWLAIVGANGSGKSSLLKYLASDDSPLADRAAIMFQDPDEQIFANTVARELALGRADGPAPGLAAEFGLAGREESDPRLLSAGQKQRLVLAVAMGGAPGLLLCDEPTSLQDPAQAGWVLDRLENWRNETGGALVTATCDRAEAARADDLLVLAEGRIVACGPASELLDSPQVVELLGAADKPGAGSDCEPVAPMAGDPVLELRGVGCEFADGGGFGGVELTVRPGERWGLLGANGSGKSTLLAACVGARSPESGEIRLAGRPLYQDRALDLDHGLALLAPQFPEYLFSRPTVAAEVALDPELDPEQGGVSLAEWLNGLGLEPAQASVNPHDLSCGRRRRLALGLVLHAGRPLVLLDEPTAALDSQGRQQALALLRDLPRRTAVVIASHDEAFLRAAGCRLRRLTTDGLQEAD